jgi:2,5-furandicarboxylate decarboxylase 1
LIGLGKEEVMPFKDLREFLGLLEEKGDLIRVKRKVNLHTEVGKALRKLYHYGGKSVIFEHPGDCQMALCAGIFSTRKKTLWAFEATEENIFEKVLNGLQNPIKPVLREAGECQEVVLDGADIDLFQIPVPTYNPEDGGPYLTAAITVSKDPETGIPDIGHYRFQVIGKDKMSFLAQPFHRFGKNMAKAIKMRVPFEAALFIGGDPILGYTCQTQLPDDTNDWEIAGGYRGQPVELVKCRTVDLEVPATSEIVLELKIHYDETYFEGPLSEYTGYYTPPSDKPIAIVSAITHRKDPICQGLLTGKPVTENHILKQIPFEASFYREMKLRFPTVSNVAIIPSGGVSFYVIIAMQPRYAGEPKHAILHAMNSNIRPKWVIVVDDDIDIHNSADVEWAQAFRVQPARDIFIIDGVPAGPLDPSVEETENLAARTASAIGIDATRPFGKSFPKVGEVAGWEEYEFPELEGA